MTKHKADEERVEEKFTDQFFSSTESRNDIRREQIVVVLQQHEEQIREEAYKAGYIKGGLDEQMSS